MIEKDCHIVEFVDEAPIVIDLEFQKYFESAEHDVKEVYFEESHWVEQDEEYVFVINKDIHNMNNLLVNQVFIYEDEKYRPALSDYNIEVIKDERNKDDYVVTFYSDEPYKGKVIIYGRNIT